MFLLIARSLRLFEEHKTTVPTRLDTQDGCGASQRPAEENSSNNGGCFQSTVASNKCFTLMTSRREKKDRSHSLEIFGAFHYHSGVKHCPMTDAKECQQ